LLRTRTYQRDRGNVVAFLFNAGLASLLANAFGAPRTIASTMIALTDFGDAAPKITLCLSILLKSV
jgi:hypothetical protein